MTVREDDIRRAVGPDMTSGPDDPHGWTFNCEVVPIVKTTVNTVTKLKAWWICRLCGTTVRVTADVTRGPFSGNGVYDEMAALSEMSVRAAIAKRDVHPRCSEVRLVKDVMDS